VTDGEQSVRVVHHGDPPELFKDGIPVVCEGHWQGDVFDSDRIMISTVPSTGRRRWTRRSEGALGFGG